MKDKNGIELGDKNHFLLWFDNTICQKHLDYYWQATQPTNKYHKRFMEERGC